MSIFLVPITAKVGRIIIPRWPRWPLWPLRCQQPFDEVAFLGAALTSALRHFGWVHGLQHPWFPPKKTWSNRLARPALKLVLDCLCWWNYHLMGTHLESSLGLFPRNIFLVAISFLFWSMLKSHQKRITNQFAYDPMPILVHNFTFIPWMSMSKLYKITYRIIISKKRNISNYINLLQYSKFSTQSPWLSHFGCWKLLKSCAPVHDVSRSTSKARKADTCRVHRQLQGDLANKKWDLTKKIWVSLDVWMWFFHGTVWHVPENREMVAENMNFIGFAFKVSISFLELRKGARKWYACTVETMCWSL